MLTHEQAVRRITESGLRMTRTRAQLLRLVFETSTPFSVKMLHERTEVEGLDIHLVTVHRNLAEFVSLGLVDELPGEDNRLYAVHSDSESGAHVYCIDCRLVVPLQHLDKAERDALDALARVLVEKGFDSSTMRTMLTAHCKSQNLQRAQVGGENKPKSSTCDR